MISTAVKPSHLFAVEQGQQSLELAAILSGGFELEGKSSSQCIQLNKPLSLFNCSISLSSCLFLCTEPSFCISTRGSRRQLSIRKKARKGDSNELKAPLLLKGERAAEEEDMVIEANERNRPTTLETMAQQGLPSASQPPIGQRRTQITKTKIFHKQTNR